MSLSLFGRATIDGGSGEYMTFPKCTVCGKELQDWSGDIMVDESSYAKRKVEWVRVVCKDCSFQLDSTNLGKQLHNIWELEWFKDQDSRYWTILAKLVRDLAGAPNAYLTWGTPAVMTVLKLLAMANDIEVDEGELERLWGVDK